MGATHVRLAVVNEEVLTGALRTAWRLRMEKNRGKGRGSSPRKQD
jgi:stalled ribosome alternative rescue factor ArfA